MHETLDMWTMCTFMARGLVDGLKYETHMLGMYESVLQYIRLQTPYDGNSQYRE